jgi:S-adenosylmethionine:tRNA ribosyltransferase-isomerase
MKKSDFTYHLPDHLIAQQPTANRRDSRLLLLDAASGGLEDSYFCQFIELLQPDDLLVFNDTRVIPARLFGTKPTGGKVEILIERIIDQNRALAHARPGKSLKNGLKIQLDNNAWCEVIGRQDDLFLVGFGPLSVAGVLNEIGHMPLPPYIERMDEDSDKSRYQTVFAKTDGAIAAPTAGLHFDEDMLAQIDAKGVARAFITLHVGSGTFRPVRVENLAEHIMHKEYYAVPNQTAALVRQARERGGRVIAIGTTAVRALESASQRGRIEAGCGETDLFITPGYPFKSVDALLTNFHLPESTLLMLVAAFAGYDTVRQAYRHAVAESYRFFSYGDAMFIIR